ncbi:MAG: triose-phosphate isomerase [Rhodospirillales bacterium]|nr:triose-phosphate isomerase [Alphaproteobacteria bacterium]MBL6947818.1 triose-phosphate isomerase [Rhodospirillales bacterium]
MPNDRRPLIAGNWKMNGQKSDGLSLAEALAQRMKAESDPVFDMVVCPPFTLVADVGNAIADSGIGLGGQDCHTAENGAHTGDISATMLSDIGCGFVIVGHSERRTDHGETDLGVKAKAAAAQAAGLCAIICIGETEAERDAGQTFDVVKTQLSGSVPDGSTAANTVIAYEPVWAIGTGRTPSLEEVQEVHALIREELTKAVGESHANGTRVLYGGSMKPENARELIALEDVDGGLIGGASLKAEDFWAIAQSCV